MTNERQRKSVDDIIYVVSMEIKQRAKDGDQWHRDDFCVLFVPSEVIMT